MLGIAPRIGYVLPLGETVAFWPRLGFSNVHASLDTPERTTEERDSSQFHVGLTAGLLGWF